MVSRLVRDDEIDKALSILDDKGYDGVTREWVESCFPSNGGTGLFYGYTLLYIMGERSHYLRYSLPAQSPADFLASCVGVEQLSTRTLGRGEMMREKLF